MSSSVAIAYAISSPNPWLHFTFTAAGLVRFGLFAKHKAYDVKNSMEVDGNFVGLKCGTIVY